jgi:hypothetical protein
MTGPLFDNIASSWDMSGLDVPLLQEAYRYWLSKKGERPWPLRSSIEPTEIPRLLANLFLVEVSQLGPPMRYRLRLVGTAFRPFFGADITGREVHEENVSPDRARFCSDWREILQRGAPRWARIRQRVGHDGIDAARFTGLVMPLSRDGTAADMLLGATVYDPLQS